MHISIEGMDGVGKTTVCKIVARCLGYEFIEKPLKYLFDKSGDSNYKYIRDQINNQPDRVLSAWFYAFSNIYLCSTFKNKNIVTDRHILSNYCWSGEDESEDVYGLLLRKIQMPDYTFIIYANKKSIACRLKERDENDSDFRKVELAEDKYKKMEGFCKTHRIPYVLLDSSNKTAQQVADIIIEKIKEDGNDKS